MQKIWIFGDSFSRASANPKTWCNLLRDRLGCEMINISLRGSSPDWILRQYLAAAAQIQALDYVILLFTNPNRFWFYEDQPDLTNPSIVDFSQHRDPQSAAAAQGYFRYLQRPELDLQWTYYRAIAVSHETQRLGLRRPLLIRCFDQDVSAAESFDTVTWAQGALTDIQFGEYQDPKRVLESISETGRDPVFRGLDCRYNHLCLVNHGVLADKLYQSLITDSAPNLTEGFHRGILSQDWINDREFQSQQLDPEQIELYHRQNHPKNLFKARR